MSADDVIYVKTSEFHYEFLYSRRHGLLLMHDQIAQPTFGLQVAFGPIILATTRYQMRFPEWDSFSPYWIGFSHTYHPRNHVGFWIFIPYWSIVIPLTLLSAWLLLSKSRTKQPANPQIST